MSSLTKPDDDKTGALLRTESVTVGYGREAAVSGISFAVRRGERWFFLGANGSGKTTLLHTLLGRLPPLAGAIVSAADGGTRVRTGFVPQRLETAPTLPTTVAEFVRLGLVGTACARSERKRRVGRALETVGLAAFALRSLWTLSGGQRQRASLARALVREPELLLLDEPTAGLDAESETSLLLLLAELNAARGMTLVVVSHDVAVVREMASHVVILAGGHVTCGRVDEVGVASALERYAGATHERLAGLASALAHPREPAA